MLFLRVLLLELITSRLLCQWSLSEPQTHSMQMASGLIGCILSQALLPCGKSGKSILAPSGMMSASFDLS
jgi:hypothetical protein